MPSPYKRVKFFGVIFVFKYDAEFPDLLHIWARHTKNPKQAALIWFKGHHIYNESRKRFEATYQGERVFWYWINHEKHVVMVASCHDVV